MKNFLILGICSYSKAVLRYLETLRKYYSGKVVIILTDNEDKVELLKRRYDIDCRFYNEPKEFWTQKDQWLCGQWKYIKQISDEFKDHYILRTDVWDVIFQDNPQDYINFFIDKCYISSENIANINNQFQMSWYSNSNIFPLLATNEQLLNLPVINSGLICCKGSLLSTISNEIMNNIYGTKLDQTELNISIMCKEYLNSTKNINNFFNYSDSFLECINFTLRQKGIIKDKTIYTENTKTKWCVVHENSNPKTIIDNIYPLFNYKE